MTQDSTHPVVADSAPSGSVRRKQTAIDVVLALVLTMLVWPFPVARMNLTPVVHVISILVLWQLVQIGYFVVAAAVWRKTAGMYLLGLGLATGDHSVPDRAAAMRWAVIAGLLGIARLFTGGPSGGRSDMAERVSAVSVVVSG